MQGSNNNKVNIFDADDICFNSKPLSFAQSCVMSDGQQYRAIETSQSHHHSIANSLDCPSGGLFDHAKPVACLSFPPSKVNVDVKVSPDVNLTHAPASLVTVNKYDDRLINHLNSCLCNFSSSEACLDFISSSLNRMYMDDDIEINIDYPSKCLCGNVFMTPYDHNVEFIIYVWPQDHSTVRVEFRRSNGHALAAAQLWSDVQDLLHRTCDHCDDNNDDDDNNNTLSSFINLDFNLDGFADADIDIDMDKPQWTDMDFNNLVESLIKNDEYILADLQELHTSIQQCNDLCSRIMSHASLMMHLVDTSLLNADACVCRCVLQILNELALYHENQLNQIISQSYNHSNLFYNHMSLLLGHERKYIRQWTIRVLSNLSNTSCVWNMDNMSRQCMIDNVKRCALLYNNNNNNNNQSIGDDEVNSFRSMIEKINTKLMIQQ